MAARWSVWSEDRVAAEEMPLARGWSRSPLLPWASPATAGSCRVPIIIACARAAPSCRQALTWTDLSVGRGSRAHSVDTAVPTSARVLNHSGHPRSRATWSIDSSAPTRARTVGRCGRLGTPLASPHTLAFRMASGSCSPTTALLPLPARSHSGRRSRGCPMPELEAPSISGYRTGLPRPPRALDGHCDVTQVGRTGHSMAQSPERPRSSVASTSERSVRADPRDHRVRTRRRST